MPVSAAGIWMRALPISALVFVCCGLIGWTVMRRLRPVAETPPAAAPVATTSPVAAPVAAEPGLLARARVRPEALLAIAAEDHYCRLHHQGGASVLILARFGDALAAVADLDGAQVHRGAWVAADAVAAALRDGRRWRLRLVDGTSVPVSTSHVAEARRRGWLARPERVRRG
jgi:hypothetical protein